MNIAAPLAFATTLTLAFSAILNAAVLPGTNAPPPGPPIGPDIRQEIASTNAAWQIRSRQAHQTEWYSVRYLTNTATLRVRAVTNSFVELATALNYPDPATGEWRPASPAFAITDHGVEANACGHQVRLAPDINSPGAVRLTHGTNRFEASPLCVGYYDPVDGRSYLLGELTNAIGWLTASNEVVYSNCFVGDIRASIRFRNSLAGLEQDLLLHERPAVSPLDLGFSAHTRIELFTEIFGDSPFPEAKTRVIERENDAATRAQMLEPDLTDSTLTFGSLHMPSGKAFAVGLPGPGQPLPAAIPVAKRFERMDGRRVVIEAVPLRRVQSLLDQLPAAPGGITNAGIRASSRPNEAQVALAPPPRAASAGRDKAFIRALPERRLTRVPTDARIQTAASLGGGTQGRDVNLAAMQPPALVLDWQLLTTGPTSYTLRSDITYLISSTFTVNHLTLEGGCIAKFDNNLNARIVVNNSLQCLSDAYRPILFTSRYDTSIGEEINPPGTIPSNRLFTGLYLNGWNFTGAQRLAHLRVSHAGTGVVIDWGSDWTVQDCQFVTCSGAVDAYGTDINLKVFNVLVTGDKVERAAFYSADGGTLNAQHVTAHRVGFLSSGWDLATFVNSLVVDLAYNPGTLGDGSANLWNSVGSSIFESSGFGHHYLPSDSPHRDQGVTSIHPDLLERVSKTTTSAPLPLTGPIGATTLSPRDILDADEYPDRGYHYDALDYLAYNVTVQSTLTLEAGVAIGWRSDYAFRGGTILGSGGPSLPNRISHLAAVQESPTPEALPGGLRVGLEPAHAELQFTRFTMPKMSQESYHAGGWYGDLLRLRSCELFNGGLWHSKGGSMDLNNCLLERVTVVADQENYDVETEARNCLLKGVNFWVYALAPVEIRDCVLWESASQYGTSISSSHNGYIACPVLYGSTGSDHTGLEPEIFPLGPLGFYYQAEGSPLIDAGSRTAADAGLDQFTVHANPIPDSGPVAIGYHYPEFPRAMYEAVIRSQNPDHWFMLNKLNNGLPEDGLVNAVSGGPNLASVGGTWDPDAFVHGNSAFSFTSASDRLTVSDVISGGTGSSKGSVSLLFRSLPRPAAAKRYLFCQKGSSGTEFGVYFQSGALNVEIGDQIVTIPPPPSDFGAWYVGAWYYLAITWNEDTDVAKWYVGRVRGTLASGQINGLAANVGNSSTVFIGNRQNDSGTFTSAFREGNDSFGALDEIVFWYRALREDTEVHEVSDQFNTLSTLFQGPSSVLAFDLTRWNLMLPVDKFNQLEDEDPETPLSKIPLQIDMGWLSSGFNYVDPATWAKKYFYRDGNTMVFEAPWNGAVDGTGPRSELRGMKYDGTRLTEDNWQPVGTHTLAGTCRIMDNGNNKAKIIIGQIHAKTDPAKPAITLHVDYSANPSFMEVAVYDTPTSDPPGHHPLVPPLNNVALNKDIEYELRLDNSPPPLTLHVTVTYNEEEHSVDVPMNAAWLQNQFLYFKAGCYFPDALEGTTKVTFSSLSATP